MIISKRRLTKIKGSRYCTVEVTLREFGRGPELSICGSEGRIVKRAKAKQEAREYWIGFFESDPSEIAVMNTQCGRRFTSARGAAQFVIESDGDFHGLDIEGPDTGATVRVLESCGQITGIIKDFFQEVTPMLKWHQNGMSAGCEHQEALGWSHDKCGIACPECGYRYGTAWLYRTLPKDVITWARSFGEKV